MCHCEIHYKQNSWDAKKKSKNRVMKPGIGKCQANKEYEKLNDDDLHPAKLKCIKNFHHYCLGFTAIPRFRAEPRKHPEQQSNGMAPAN